MPKRSGARPAGERRLSRQVWDVLGRDGALLDTLSRGVVNQRALARWLIDTYTIDATEEAVVGAVRRGLDRERGRPFDAAHGLVARSHVNVRTEICQVLAAKVPHVQAQIPKIFNHIDFSRGELFYMTEGESAVKLVVDERNLPMVKDALGEHSRQIRRGLAAISVVLPEDALETPGVLALITTTLAIEGINALDAVYGFPEYAFVVKKADAQKAFQVLDALVERAEA